LWKFNPLGDTLWSRSYATDGGDDYFLGVTALSDGGVLALGHFFSDFTHTDEALVVRTNASGAMVWQRGTNVAMNFTGWDAAEVANGEFIVAASSGLIKINANGDTLWTRRYDFIQTLGVVALSDGGAMVSGNYRVGDAEALVMRCDAQGDTVWTRRFAAADLDIYPWDIVRTGDGEYVTAGQITNIPGGDFEGTWAAKLSESGQVRWSNTYVEHAYFYDLATGPDGLPVAVGGVEDLPNHYDILLMKLDGAGNEVWTTTYLSGLDEKGYAICATSDGGFVVTGIVGGIASPDIIIIKVNENGEI
jgi:hypothetical protein